MTTDFASSKHGCVADALELGRLSDGEPGMDPELLRAVYRHARGEDGKRVLFENDSTFTRGWINLDTPWAGTLIAAFVPLDDDGPPKRARYLTQANLEAQPWSDVLGIEDPPIRCRVKIHGTRWGLRFESGRPGLKGKELVNENLPPIPEKANAPGAALAPLPAETPSGAAPATTGVPDDDRAAADALRSGGFPS